MNQLKTILIKDRFLIVLFIGLITGTIIANVVGIKHISDWGIFDSGFMERYMSVNIDSKNLWLYVIRSRLKDVIFLFLIGLTSISIQIAMLYMFYIGMGIGLIISMAVMQYGIYGVWLYVVSVFPQYIFYGFAIYIIIRWLNVKIVSDRTKSSHTTRILTLIPVTCCVVIIGTLAEAFINPMIMTKIINSFYW